MLCEKIRNIIKIAEVCLSDSRAFSSGMTFDGVTIAETGCIADKSILNRRITCHGITDSGEPLVSTGNMRYFFTLKDGWGEKNRRLYALSIGFYIDFGASVTLDILEKMLSEPANPKGVYAGLAEQEKRKHIKTIISVLKSE